MDLKAYTANFQVILFLDEKTLMCLAYLPFVQLDRTQDYGSWNVGSNPMRKTINQTVEYFFCQEKQGFDPH